MPKALHGDIKIIFKGQRQSVRHRQTQFAVPDQIVQPWRIFHHQRLDRAGLVRLENGWPPVWSRNIGWKSGRIRRDCLLRLGCRRGYENGHQHAKRFHLDQLLIGSSELNLAKARATVSSRTGMVKMKSL